MERERRLEFSRKKKSANKLGRKSVDYSMI